MRLCRRIGEGTAAAAQASIASDKSVVVAQKRLLQDMWRESEGASCEECGIQGYFQSGVRVSAIQAHSRRGEPSLVDWQSDAVKSTDHRTPK